MCDDGDGVKAKGTALWAECVFWVTASSVVGSRGRRLLLSLPLLHPFLTLVVSSPLVIIASWAPTHHVFGPTFSLFFLLFILILKQIYTYL